MLATLQAFQNAGRGNIYGAYAVVTSPVIYSTAAGTGGPLLWNGSSGGAKVNAFILAVTYGLSVASTVAGAIGITGNTGQPSAPTSTSAITTVGNWLVGGQSPQCTAYNVGTVANAGNFFIPVGMVHTGAITVDTTDDNWVDLGGGIIVTPGSWAAVAASATLSTAVMQIGLVWAEVPV